MSGRAVFNGLLKLIPRVGPVIGGLISATTAAAITSTFGEASMAMLDTLFVRHQGNPPSQQEVVDELRRRLGSP